MSEHTTNLTKTLEGRFLEQILTKKHWNLLFCDFSAENLHKTQHFESILWNWKFYQKHFLMKNYIKKVDTC